jgi:hypothetical protein
MALRLMDEARQKDLIDRYLAAYNAFLKIVDRS